MSIVVFLALFLIYTLIGKSVFPVDPETNVLIAPDWYPFLGLAVTVFPTIIFHRIRKKRRDAAKQKKFENAPKVAPNTLICRSGLEPIKHKIAFNCAAPYTSQAQATCKNIDIPEIIREEENWRRSQRGLSKIDYELYRIDTMDGHAFEFWCADLLHNSGFDDVIVTPGSNDQGVDITASREEVRYAVQCKCFSSDVGNKPIQEVYAGKEIYDCQVAVVMTNRHFTASAKTLAEKTRVLLWDRDKLTDMLRNQK